jgi:hypothetical protein
MSLSPRLRHLAIAICVGLAIAVAGTPADAVEAPPGSRNFTPPSDVPNYFSNESGPFQGRATARNAQPEAVPVVAAPTSHRGRAVASRRASRHHHPGHVAKAGGRTRLAHGRASGHRQVAHAGAVRRGHASGPKVAHAAGSRMAHAPAGHLAGKTVAAKTRAASSKNKHLARAHG